MRIRVFCVRTAKEVLRDPLTLVFGLGFPLVLLGLMSAIQANIPIELFPIASLAPGVGVFGLTFLALFSGLLIARDRESALMLRLFASPMTATDFIFGYTLPMLALAVAQLTVCYAFALCLGLAPTWRIAAAIAATLPAAVLFIAIGLLCGSALTERQVSGLCGALLTNLSGWLAGIWFSPDLLGEGFVHFVRLLPFVHAVDAGRAALAGDTAALLPALVWVTAYATVFCILSIVVFTRNRQVHT
jgi:ABC-2 type transport system permease protein